jgi:hypothetical protein
LALCPAEFQCYVLSFLETGFGEPFAECGYLLRARSGRAGIQNPITGIDGCCARAPSGHVAAPPSSEMNSRRPMNPVISSLQLEGLQPQG